MDGLFKPLDKPAFSRRVAEMELDELLALSAILRRHRLDLDEEMKVLDESTAARRIERIRARFYGSQGDGDSGGDARH